MLISVRMFVLFKGVAYMHESLETCKRMASTSVTGSLTRPTATQWLHRQFLLCL